jgi:hypothetical protein
MRAELRVIDFLQSVSDRLFLCHRLARGPRRREGRLAQGSLSLLPDVVVLSLLGWRQE